VVKQSLRNLLIDVSCVGLFGVRNVPAYTLTREGHEAKRMIDEPIVHYGAKGRDGLWGNACNVSHPVSITEATTDKKKVRCKRCRKTKVFKVRRK